MTHPSAAPLGTPWVESVIAKAAPKKKIARKTPRKSGRAAAPIKSAPAGKATKE